MNFLTGHENFMFQVWQESFPMSKYLLDSQTSLNSLDSDVLMQTSWRNESSTVYLREKIIKNRKLHATLKQTKTLATLVPDTVISCDALLQKNINPLVCVLMCADISGFTALSEKCSTLEDGGVYRLTSIINGFLGKMVAAIYDYGGDVWKFSGDSFLAIWKLQMNENFSRLIHRALNCAMYIQKSHGHYVTELKTYLHVKIGMSAGNVVWCAVGDHSSLRTVLAGPAVLEVKKAETLCGSGDVVLAASVWNYISPMDCVHEVLLDGQFIKVTRLLGYLGLTSPTAMKLVRAPSVEPYIHSFHTGQKVRSLPDLSLKVDLGSDLRLYVLPPVVQQVDADLSLEFLTEIRTLTLMFVHIIPNELLTTEIIAMVDKVYNVIHSIVSKAGGFVEKVSLFDKDVMFLTIFGFRCFLHDGQVAACLKCGYDIWETCVCVMGVKNASVGIATGMTYCGVVGHPLRQEFTVIGPAVNKAARIMVAYPNNVTCDSVTYAAAELPRAHFVPAPFRPLRGFDYNDSCYHFIPEKGRTLHFALQVGLPPLLGREDEMDICHRLLNELHDSRSDPFGLFIVGEVNVGKSRLLDEMIAETYRRGLAPVVLGLRQGHSMVPFSAAIHILCQVLRIPKLHAHREVQEGMAELLQNRLSPEELTYVRHMFDDECPSLQPSNRVTPHMKRIFNMVLSFGMSSRLLAIDDVDLSDAASWELLMSAVEAHCKCFLLTCQTNRSKLLIPSNVTRQMDMLYLQPLSPSCVPPLACQATYADAIHVDVTTFLEARSRGNPGVCLQLLRILIDNHFVDVKEVDRKQAQSMRLHYPASRQLALITINPPPLPPSRPRKVLNHVSSIDPVMFDYRDLKRTLLILSKQRWWRRRRKSISASTSARKSSLIDEMYASMEETRKLLKVEAVKKHNKINTKPIEWSLLVKQMFGYGSELYSGVEVYSGCMRIVPLQMPTDERIILEAMEIFKKMKQGQGFMNENEADPSLDLLRRNQTKKCYSRFRESQSENKSKMDIREEFEEELLTKKVVISPRTSMAKVVTLSSSLLKKGMIVAILKVPGVNLDLTGAPESYVGLLSIFDSLRPFEQMLLKCSSVIGVKFKRAMLDAILHYPNPFYTSLAIKRLFDLNILGCTETRRHNNGKRCICEQPRDSLPDLTLPPYAFCINLRFIHVKLRDTLYDILPPNQKRMFHERAVEFLVKRSSLCSHCERQLGDGTHPPRFFDGTHLKNLEVQRTESLIRVRVPITMLKFIQALVAEPMLDLNNCTCLSVQRSMLDVLIAHCKAADRINDTINHYMSYVRVCMNMAMFNDARVVLNSIKDQIHESSIMQEKRDVLAEVELLIGELRFQTGALDDGLCHLKLAMHYLIPSLSFLRLPSVTWSFIKRQRAARVAVRTLNIMTEILMIKKEFKKAQTLCLLNLKVLHRSDDPIELCKAYANLVDIALSLQSHLLDMDLDDRIVKVGMRVLPVGSIKDAVALVRLLHAWYIIRTIGAGDLSTGAQLLMGMARLGQTTPLSRGRELVLMEQIHLFTLQGNVREAASAMLHLRGGSSSQQFWFHAFALAFVMTTGFWVEKPRDSLDFLTTAVRHGNLTDPACKRGKTVLLLWLLWTEPHRALEWQRSTEILSQPAPVRSLADCIWRVEELLMLALQARVLPTGAPWGPRLTRTLRVWVSDLDAMILRYRVMLPMYLFVRAYMAYRLERNIPWAQQLLVDAAKHAQEQGNEVITARISLTREAWRLESQLVNPSKSVAQLREWTEWRPSDWPNSMLKLP